MNLTNLRKSPALIALGGGFLGMALRFALYRIGFDEKGILSSSHPLHLVCLALTAMMTVYLAFRAWKTREPASGHGPLRMLCGLPAAGFLLLQAMTLHWSLSNPLTLVRMVLMASAGLAMAVCSFLGHKNRPVAAVCHGSVCAALGADLLGRYQSWSGNPQLPDYVFHVLAGVALSLAAYQTLALHTGLGKPRLQRFYCLLALFLCPLCLIGPGPRVFYFSGTLWAAACLLTVVPPEMEEAPEAEPAMVLPDYILTCIDALEAAGFQAWAVGGCVRDSILGLTPSDYDLCTDALPEQTEAVFAGYPLILNGKKHGTVAVILDKNVVEITTFRTEGEYKDNRHPEWVEFVPDIKEDLARRDFTVNAMAYSPRRGFADPFGGREDLKNKVLRAVGDPEQRFREDSLRILRGARFAVKYRLVPEDATEKAMADLAPLMDNLARERVWGELCKLLLLADTSDLVRFAPVITQVIPELAPQLGYDQNNHHHCHDLYTHTALVTAAMPRKPHLRWAALLHDIGKPATRTVDEKGEAHYHGHAQVSTEMAREALLRLKAPTLLREQAELLIEKHMVWFPLDKKVIRRWISRLGFEMFRDLIALQRSDCLGTGTAAEAELAHFDQIEAFIREIEEENTCLTLKDLAVNGHDLMALGYQGRDIGEKLNWLLNRVLNEELPNEKTALIAALEETE